MSVLRFCFFVLCSWVAVALFFSGFLLSKQEILTRGTSRSRFPQTPTTADTIPDVNNIRRHHESSPTRHQEHSASQEKQGQRRNIKRVFIFVVDALRLDFMTPRPPSAADTAADNTTPGSSSSSSSSSYNQFQHMHHLLRENASQCALFGFHADPPTTTSQRLKGLMTGSLPTFVELGANFHSAAVAEDSLLDQWLHSSSYSSNNNSGSRGSGSDKKKTKKKMVMMGDDTWLNLFPDAFSRAFPFDSFNTRDLDTVDDGIIRHLFPLLGADTPSYFTSTTTATATTTATTAATTTTTTTAAATTAATPSATCSNSGASSDSCNQDADVNCSGSLLQPPPVRPDHETKSEGHGDSEGESDSEGDWDILIAHFLGVDHIGHTHHAFHPAMSSRLARMDQVLAAVIARLQQQDEEQRQQQEQEESGKEEGDTLLLLFGDHGMTDAGEHGGNSLEETMSGLFVYSTGQLFPEPVQKTEVDAEAERGGGGGGGGGGATNTTTTTTLSWDRASGSFQAVPLLQALHTPRVIEQVDLAPTLALLLGGGEGGGVGIPYTSLGQVVPELFQLATRRGCGGALTLTEAYRENAMQVMRYLFHYFLAVGEDSSPPLQQLLEPPHHHDHHTGACVGAALAEESQPPPLLQAWRTDVLDTCLAAESSGAGAAEQDACFRQAIRLAVQGWVGGAAGAEPVPLSVCAPVAASAPASGRQHGWAPPPLLAAAAAALSPSSWRARSVCAEIEQLHHAYLEARGTHALLDQLEAESLPPPSSLSHPSPLAQRDLLLRAAVRQRAQALYAEFLSSCLSFSRVQWSHFNVHLMVCGLSLGVMCLLLSLRALGSLLTEGAAAATTTTTTTTTAAAAAAAASPFHSFYSHCSSCSYSSLMTCALLLFHCLSPLSNSFVLQEPAVLCFQLQLVSLLRLREILLLPLLSTCPLLCSTSGSSARAGLWLIVKGGAPRQTQQYSTPSDSKKEQQHRTSAMFLCGAVVLELCALCIARWLLHVWRGPGGGESEGDGGRVTAPALLWRLWADIGAPVLFFVLSFCGLALWLSSLAVVPTPAPALAPSCRRGTGRRRDRNRDRDRDSDNGCRSWPEWLASQRVASKLFFMAAAASLLPHCAIHHTPLFGDGGGVGASLAASASAHVPACEGYEWVGAGAERLLMLPLRALHANQHSDWLQLGLPCLCLGSSAAGLCLEEALRRRRKRGGAEGLSRPLRQQHLVFLLQSALHTYVHVANAVILVSVSVQNRSLILVLGQLWFSACLLGSYALVAMARSGDEEDEGEGERCQAQALSARQTQRQSQQHACQLAVQLSAMGRLLFFLSNHRYDFGTMQLSAGLVGATTFHFWRAGCLVALNTAGHSLLALLSLRALAAISTSTTTTSPAAESTTAVGERPSPGPVPVPVRGGGGEGGGVRLVVWAASASRLAPVLGSMGAALLLRRHLMLWAVFAPKVIFEAAFWLVDAFFLCLLYLQS